MAAESHSPVLRSSPWLYGPGLDLLIGAGVGYLLTAPFLILLSQSYGLGSWPFFAVWLFGICANAPHYGATLLRVYEQREDRRKYAIFAVWITLLLLLLFAVGVRHALLGSLLVTLYFTWSPWHFGGQNYGIALMFLRRRQVPISRRAKGLLYASFALSFALAFVALHVEASTSVYAPVQDTTTLSLDLLRLGIPRPAAAMLMLGCGAAYLGSLLGAFGLLLRGARIRDLVPLAALVLCQAMWFAVPAALDLAGAWTTRGLAFAAIWISAAHSLQYLWVTSYYAKRSQRPAPVGWYLAKTVLAGNAVLVVPGMLAAPGLVGGMSWDAGLGILVFSVVNLHHFVLDGAVWKLRDGRVSRALLRSDDGPQLAPALHPIPSSRAWGLALLWALCAGCLAAKAGELAQDRAARAGRYQQASAILDGLAWVGRDSSQTRLYLGRRLLEQEQLEAAAAEFERSIELKPSVAAWGGLGRSLDALDRVRSAADAYEAGLQVDPSDVPLLRSAAGARIRLREPERAVELLQRALVLEPDDDTLQTLLRRARRMQQRRAG